MIYRDATTKGNLGEGRRASLGLKKFCTTDILKSIGAKFLTGLSEALSYHSNPVLLKKYLTVMADLGHKLVKYENRREIVILLQYFMKFFQRLLVADTESINGHKFPIDVIRINRCIDTNPFKPEPIEGMLMKIFRIYTQS